MSRSTRLSLIAGCALVLILEAPATISAVVAGWRGPYAGRALETSRLETSRLGAEAARAPLELARAEGAERVLARR